jgi:hypothetical protein
VALVRCHNKFAKCAAGRERGDKEEREKMRKIEEKKRGKWGDRVISLNLNDFYVFLSLSTSTRTT